MTATFWAKAEVAKAAAETAMAATLRPRSNVRKLLCIREALLGTLAQCCRSALRIRAPYGRERDRATGISEGRVSRTTLIGIDVGTTGTKAVLLDETGTRLGQYARTYPTARPQAGYAEQNPDHWMAAVTEALATFARSHDLGGLRGIGIVSQVNTHVFVDGSGKALLPAIVWQDGRSAP